MQRERKQMRRIRGPTLKQTCFKQTQAKRPAQHAGIVPCTGGATLFILPFSSALTACAWSIISPALSQLTPTGGAPRHTCHSPHMHSHNRHCLARRPAPHTPTHACLHCVRIRSNVGAAGAWPGCHIKVCETAARCQALTHAPWALVRRRPLGDRGTEGRWDSSPGLIPRGPTGLAGQLWHNPTQRNGGTRSHLSSSTPMSTEEFQVCQGYRQAGMRAGDEH